MKKSARYRHRCIGKGKCFDMNIWELDMNLQKNVMYKLPFDINIRQFDMNIANLIYKCIVDT